MKITIEIENLNDLVTLKEWIESAPDIRRIEYSTPIDKLKLSERTKNVLLAEKIKTLGELITFSENDLCSIEGFGSKTIEEIKIMLAFNGYVLAGTKDY